MTSSFRELKWPEWVENLVVLKSVLHALLDIMHLAIFPTVFHVVTVVSGTTYFRQLTSLLLHQTMIFAVLSHVCASVILRFNSEGFTDHCDVCPKDTFSEVINGSQCFPCGHATTAPPVCNLLIAFFLLFSMVGLKIDYLDLSLYLGFQRMSHELYLYSRQWHHPLWFFSS